MSTDAQIHANQQNAQRSTGPLTDGGKSAASRNSFRHGLSAATIVALPGENIQDYIDLGNNLRAEHKPVTVTEDALVAKMAQALWLGKRATNLQQQVLLAPESNQSQFDLFHRYQKTQDRAFSKAFDDLIKLRKQARQEQIGFVSHTQNQNLIAAKIQNLTARTEAKILDTHLRRTRAAAVSTPQFHLDPQTEPSTGATQQAA